MSISGPLTLLASAIALIIALVAAQRLGIVDRLARALSGHRPPTPQLRESPRHLRIVREGPPRPLPDGRSPCDLAGWDDPEDVA